VDGVRVTRSSNEIDDLIGGVTLKLQGPGKVLLDITTTWNRL
jgi:flagellar capping protein FliD